MRSRLTVLAALAALAAALALPASALAASPIVDSFHDKGTDTITLFDQIADDCGKITTPVRRKRTCNVLQDNNLWNSPITDHASHELPERLECSTMLALQARAVSSQ